jgi:outer membrane protein assembly factor BamB
MACRRAHRLAVAAALGLSALACLVPATAADWPQFGRTPRHTNANPSERAFTPENVATLEVKWNADMGANVAVQGGPVIAGGGLFVAGFDGMLKAYDIAGCGAAVCPPLWQGRTDNDITTTPAVSGGRVVVSSADRFIHVFDASGCGAGICDALWRGRLGAGAIDSSPTIAGGFIYVGDLSGQLSVFAFDGCGQDVCDPVWTAHAGPHEVLTSTPAVAGGSVFIQTTFNTDNDTSGRLLVFPDGCGAATCEVAWSARLGGQTGNATGPLIALGKVFVGSSRRFGIHRNPREHVLAFDASGCGTAVCEPVQFFDVGPEGVDSSLALAGHMLYASTDTSTDPNTAGVVMVFDIAQCGVHCKPAWTGVNFIDGFVSAAVVTQDVVFVGKGPALDIDAGVFAFDARGCGQALCRALTLVRPSDSGNYIGAPLAVAHDRIAFVNNDNNLNRSQVTVIGLPD